MDPEIAARAETPCYPHAEGDTALGFPEKLKALRLEKGWSQNDLADRTGVTKLMISKYETGRHNPPLDKLASLAQVLGVTTDYLISDGVPRDDRVEVQDVELHERFQQAQHLHEGNRAVLKSVIDALIAREQADQFAEERAKIRTKDEGRSAAQKK